VRIGRRRNQTPCNRAGCEEHGDEEQATAEEDGREEAVLALTDAVAEHTDEPQEGDAGKRQQLQAECNRPSLAVVGDPIACILRS
jgi:hypothetical protein